MKTILAITLLIISNFSFAETVNFQCKAMTIPGVNVFSAKGMVSVDELSKASGVINILVQKIDEEESAQVFEQIKIEGLIKHFNPGDVSVSGFDQLVLTTDHSYLKSLNLLLDEGSEYSSQVLSIDNFLYRSNCEIIK